MLVLCVHSKGITIIVLLFNTGEGRNYGNSNNNNNNICDGTNSSSSSNNNDCITIYEALDSLAVTKYYRGVAKVLLK